MSVPIEKYSGSFVSSGTKNNVTEALNTFESQVNFGITQSGYSSYNNDRIDCSNITGTACAFEDWLNNNNHLSKDTHYMLVANCSTTDGVGVYNVGRNQAQYPPHTYGISVLYLGSADTSTQKVVSIQEFCHTIMSQDDGTCPDTSSETAEEHSCGGVYTSNYDASPMIASYTGDAAANNWTICYGEPINHDGGYSTDITECTERHTEEHVSTYI